MSASSSLLTDRDLPSDSNCMVVLPADTSAVALDQEEDDCDDQDEATVNFANIEQQQTRLKSKALYGATVTTYQANHSIC